MTGEVKVATITLTFNMQVFLTNLVVAGGRKPKKKFLTAIAPEKKIFCADQGVDVCWQTKLKPALVVGDLDSAEPKAIRWAETHGACIEKLNPVKDDTDFKVLLDKVMLDNPNDILCTGVFAGRFDHLWSLVNYAWAYQIKHKRRIILADHKEIVFFLDKNDEQVIIEYNSQIKNISILPLALTSCISIKGVKWPLSEKKLEQTQPFSISNQFEAGKDAHLCLHSGCVAIYIQC